MESDDDKIDLLLSPSEVAGKVSIIEDEDGTPFLELTIGDETVTLPMEATAELVAQLRSLSAQPVDDSTLIHIFGSRHNLSVELITAKKPS